MCYPVPTQVQSQPALAATKVKDSFKESQEQAAQFEKLIKERGGSLFKLKLPEVRDATLACHDAKGPCNGEQ